MALTGYSLGISITHMNSINKPYVNGLVLTAKHNPTRM